ncbi:hypothetical protein FRX31_021099, partial [Thalictrum thalictroides]
KNSAIDDTKSKLDLGIKETVDNAIDEKEVQSNLGFCGKDQTNDELLQTTPREQTKEIDKRFRDGEPKSVLKLAKHISLGSDQLRYFQANLRREH